MELRKYLILKEIQQQFNASNSKRPTRKLQSNMHSFNHLLTEQKLDFCQSPNKFEFLIALNQKEFPCPTQRLPLNPSHKLEIAEK
jgi:hypothetical protein